VSKEIQHQRKAIEAKTLDMAGIIAGLLPRGHVIHGYSSASGERVIKILKERTYSDDADMLGFGVDGRAERALGRALLTYAKREQDGLASIGARQYPETDQAQVPGGIHLSRFDNIVWGGDFALYQDGDVVVASSNYGGDFGLSPLEVTGTDALTAITALADNYHFLNGSVRERMSRLPAISLE
jgi:hypothetical protein